VRGLVDVLVLLLQPEAGDDVQWEKAGVMEVADVVAVNKADLPGADLAVAQVRAALALSGTPAPVLPVSSRTGAGVEELGEAVSARPLRRRPSDAGRRHLLRLAQELLERRFAQAAAAADPQLEEILTRWQRGTTTTAAAELLGLLAQRA
jgi:LAO/AO transport system kinase